MLILKRLLKLNSAITLRVPKFGFGVYIDVTLIDPDCDRLFYLIQE